MDKPLIKYREFELYNLREEDILPFSRNLSKENVREFDVLYHTNPYNGLLSMLDDDLSHAVKVDGEIVAVSGVYGRIFYAMFSKRIKKNWRGLVRGSPRLISYYHNFINELECNIWSENIFTMNWVCHLGFEPKNNYTDVRGNPMVHFVRCKYRKDNVHSELSRPVMH